MKKYINAMFCQDLPKRDIQNANRVNICALLWASSLCVVIFCADYEWFSGIFIVAVAFLVNVIIGLVMVLSYRKLLINLDEMERKIQLDALAISVGVTIVSYAGYSILEKSSVLPELKASYLIVLISLSYVVGILSGRLRYL